VPLGADAVRRLATLAGAKRYGDMEALARELTRSYPNSGLAWKALGVACQLQDKDALGPLQRAVRLLPRDAETHSNLGSALRRIGRLQESVASYRNALEIRPSSAEVWNNLGNALRDLGQHDDACAAFHRALQLLPGFAKACNNLGNVLRDMGRFDDAIDQYRRAVARDPSYAEAHYNLGAALRVQMRTTEAESSCRRALELDPNFVPAIILSAELQADRGEFAAAEASYRHASAIEPDSPESWAGIAGLKRMTASDIDWLSDAQRIVSLPLAPRRELYLRYALGKYFDDVGEYREAFDNYRRANELAKVGRPLHDRGRISTEIAQLMDAHDNDWVRRMQLDANQSDLPVFIVGMPRSGTTLAEQILASQGGVCGAGELPFWNAAASRYVDARARGESERDLLSSMAGEYLRQLGSLSAGARRVIDKMPGNFLFLGLIHAALPKARFIHLRRHPIDTCLSIYFQNFGAAHYYSNDLEDLAHYYSEYLRIMDHWRQILTPSSLLEVTYEDLVNDPKTSSRRMVEFIGLPWDPGCLEFHRSIRPVHTFSRWQARQNITKGSVGRWRSYDAFVGPLQRIGRT